MLRRTLLCLSIVVGVSIAHEKSIEEKFYHVSTKEKVHYTLQSNTLFLKNSDNVIDLRVVDLHGREVFSQQIAAKTPFVTLREGATGVGNGSSAIYVVQLKSGGEAHHLKWCVK